MQLLSNVVLNKLFMNKSLLYLAGALAIVATAMITVQWFGADPTTVSLPSSQPTSGWMPLQSIIVPYVYDMDIYLVRGDGTRAQTFLKATFLRKSETSWGAIQKEFDAYLSVHINPKQTRLIAAKAIQQRRGGILDGTSQYRLVSIDLPTRAEETLLAGPQAKKLICPQWSPDGTRVAFWKGAPQDNDSGIFLWDVQANSLRKVSKITTFYDACEEMGTYLRWVDNDRVAVYVRGEGIWLVDVKRVTSEKIHEARGLSIRPYYSLTSKDFGKRISSLPEDIVAALWGDFKNPRAAPYWSPDKNFYFYHVVREGFWAKRWIERYDPQRQESAEIKTVWWAIYRE